MKVVISPAKTLDYESKVPTKKYTQPIFLEEAEKIAGVLKKKSKNQLRELLGVSDNLAQLNYQRNQQWSLPFTPDNARQAIYAFNGDVYRGIAIQSLPLKKLDKLQDTLRIISGQYGLLKPLDLMQPYRLEMGTALKIGRNENLYKFWDKKITEALNEELKEREPLINLASNEYFKAIKTKVLHSEIITPMFKEYKNGTYKTIAIFAKYARGLMVRYIINNNITSVEGLKGFDLENYGYDDNLSSEKELVFTRNNQ
ncbi:MAG: hypothetical protein CR989_02950 [Flavobacteriales bacterium]|nr:MAG: hypothetical protein CR989_02950 [Flavobacteriales bacterium]